MSHQQTFQQLSAQLSALAGPGELISAYWQAESSSFVRFTQGLIRQSGSVEQRELSLSLTSERRRASVELTLSGHDAEDQRRLEAGLSWLRELISALPEDPHLPPAPEPSVALSPSLVSDGSGPKEAAEAMSAVLAMGSGLDLVGILMSGVVSRGVMNSEGLLKWSERPVHQLDWSVVQSADRAVKCGWSGERWSLHEIEAKMSEARAQLEALSRPAHQLQPGLVRALLSPSAVHELFSTLNVWGGWSAQASREGRSPLAQLEAGEASFSSLINVAESAAGAAPAFERDGHERPSSALIQEGRWGGALVSPRSALQYGLSSTGASEGEHAQTLEVQGGSLAIAQGLEALGTGVYVSDLWYLNFSDRARACVTGTTRFATMWVEGGQVVAPLAVMRFDDCLYELLGERLEALSAERALEMSASTYGRRSLMSTLCPAALCSGLRFTL